MAVKCQNCGTENSEQRRFCGECGAMLFNPLYYQQDPSPSRRQPYRLRVNLLCLVGAVVAVLSLFFPWALVQDGQGPETPIGGFEFDEPVAGGSELADGFRYSITLFIIGTVLAFITPLGGIPLITGAVGFITTSFSSTSPDYDLIPWLGVVIALLSAGIVVLSFVEPIGFGYEYGQEPGLAGRLLTWSAYR